MRKSNVHNWVVVAWLAVASIGGVCHSQPIPVQPGQQSPSAGGDYAITQVGPHSRVWQNSAGQSVTEIATGLNYLIDGRWIPSVNAFAISPDGSSFVANQIQDPTTLAANINTQGAVTAVTPNGLTLRSTPVAIGLFDTASGQSVVVASLTNSIGVMVDAEHIVYTNAFVGSAFNASVVYSLPDTASFHQDVIFSGFQPNFDPTVWGFAASSTNTLQIQIFTEFYGNVPQPNLMERDLYIETNQEVRASMASPDFIDYTLDFGNYVFGPGRCYTLATSAGYAGVTVAKDWVVSGQRTFLVESIPFKSIAGFLQALPPTQKTTASLNPPARASRRMIAATLPKLENSREHKTSSAKATRVAGLLPHGVDVDYIATVSGTGPTVFASDTTYFVSGTVVLTGPVTMESAVFKFPTNVGSIEIESSLTLATTNYRTAIFTSADDNSAGTSLAGIYSGYTGTNSGHKYGNVGLWLNTSANISLNNLRFCYLSMALEINADTYNQSLGVSHTQLVDCNEGIYVNGGNGSNTNASLSFYVYNCLLTDLGTSFEIGGITLTNGTGAFNCTVDGCTNLVKVDTGTTSTGTLSFTNSIFSSLTSKGTLGSVTLTGSSNVFYSSSGATFGSYNTLTSNPYVISGAGNYYITNNSPYLTNGSTAIPAALRAQLQIKTTAAPLNLPTQLGYNITVTPVVPRDTGGVALGWHYDPIDFYTICEVLSGATLTLTNGVALAYYDASGIIDDGGAGLVSEGTPNNRNYLVYYNRAHLDTVLN